MVWEETACDWAVEFDATLKRLILAGDHDAIVNCQQLGRAVHLAVPTNEHFLPLLYVLTIRDEGDGIRFFADRVMLGSMSMRSMIIG